MRFNALVMAGLVPAINVFVTPPFRKHVDARDERGHDEVVARFDRRPFHPR
jgi:hypothetical protein